MKQLYRPVTTAEMDYTPATATMENSLRLMDNVDVPFWPEDNERKELLNRPIQYVSAMSLFVTLSGVTKVNVGLKPYEMHAYDSLFLKSGVICEVTDMSDDALFFSFLLDESFYYPIFSHLDLSVLQRTLQHLPVCHLGKERADECLSAYRQLKKHLLDEQKDVVHHEILKGYLQVLLFNVYAVYLQQDLLAEAKPTRKQELFNRFMELLQRDFRKERNVGYYADKLCVTPAYLSRVVLAQSGLTVGEHFDNFIIVEAKQLIRSRQYTIMQVSEMLNFSSQSFFGRYFKKHTGYTPLSFQQLA